MSDAAKAVFLSYASQDAEAAKRIADALRGAGVEVWFDAEGGLEHGDEWDAKIRRQIKECVLFIAVISANTQARDEGYFRIEWDLAAERARGIASGVAFILPVIIDDTKEPAALVPDRFRTVQWTKLPDGNVPPEVLQRFLKLWSHRTGALKGTETGRPRSAEEQGGGTSFPDNSQRGPKAHALVALAVIAIVAGLGWWLLRGSAPKLDATEAVAPLSAARELATKARALLAAGRVISRETLSAADDLAEQALKLDPTDAEVVATCAQVDAFMVYRGFDISDQRRQSAAKRAQRALALAPTSFEARHARAVVAGFLATSQEMLAEAEQIYRELWKERPADDVLGQELGRVLQEEDHFTDAAAVFLQAKQPLDAAWAYFYGGKFQEADNLADRLVAEKRDAPAFVLKAYVQLFGFGDMAAAQAAVSHLTPTELLNDDAAGIALRLAVVQRDAPRILQLLSPFANPFLSIGGVNYPKQYWTGYAQQMLSHPDAARSEWRGALQAVQERLKSNSADVESLGWVAVLQSLLGEKAAAEQALKLYLNYNPGSPGRWDWWEGLTILHLGGRNDEVFERLASELRRPHGQRMLYLFARSCPEFDPLRSDPRLDALLRETLPAGMKPLTATADQPASVKVDDKSVAVLAFANLSDDKANEYFSDGISEELLNVLAKIPGLKVTARTSSFHFKGKDTPIPEIARQLGVAYVIEGSVRKAGDRVRITAQLIKAADDFHVWSDNFDREVKDIFAVQDEIAGLIARNLQLKLEVAARPAIEVNPEAYRLYLEGRQILQRRTIESYAQAEKFFGRAKVLAPEWAPIYAGLADAARLRSFGAGGPAGPNLPWTEDMKQAVALANRALELDPTLAEAYVSLAGTKMLGWDLPEAERLVRRAIELNPNLADAYLVLGRTLSGEGRMDESIAALQRGVDLNPLSPRILDNLAAELGFAGRYEEAWPVIERAYALQPDSSQIQCYRVRLLANLGRREEALALARQMVANLNPEEREFRLLEATWAYRVFGMKSEAAATAAQIPDHAAEHVIVLAYLGQPQKAVPLLDQLTFGWVEDLMWGRGFDPIRDDPGYKAYLARTGLTAADARARAWAAAQPGRQGK